MSKPSITSHEHLYRLQVRDMKDYAMFLIDTDGMLCTWNSGTEKLFGYSESEWVGKHASIIFTPPDKAADVCQAEMTTARDQGCVADIRWHRRKDGSEFFANGVLNAVHDDAGELIGFTKLVTDETTRKRLEDALVESNQALEQFAYAASHDLQEPLRTVGIYAQLLLKRHTEGMSEEAIENLQLISRAIERMNGLVRDLLNYARVTAQNEPLVFSSLDHDIEAALSQLDQAVTEAGATVTHDPLPTVLTERSQMTRLFQNLIGNSIKYRSPERAPVVHVSSKPDGDRWLISVQDNGIGFSQEYAGIVFAPFRRLHGQEYPGTGVGLSICRRIVERYGGRIWAESEIGRGSVFHFTLPMQKSEDALRESTV